MARKSIEKNYTHSDGVLDEGKTMRKESREILERISANHSYQSYSSQDSLIFPIMKGIAITMIIYGILIMVIR